VGKREHRGRQLADGVGRDRERALASGLDARRLRLEVTENVILSDEDVAHDARGAPRAWHPDPDGRLRHGSRLAQLSASPADRSIKIDRYFVGRMDVSTECLEIVRSVVTLARSLSMDVVAEGVEQEAQLEAAARHGLRARAGVPALASAARRRDETRARNPRRRRAKSRAFDARACYQRALARRGTPPAWAIPIHGSFAIPRSSTAQTSSGISGFTSCAGGGHLGEVRDHHPRTAILGEGRAAGEDLVADHRERVDIRHGHRRDRPP
jgi:hypothetical protein